MANRHPIWDTVMPLGIGTTRRLFAYIAAIDEDRKMRNIALALNNEEIMNKIMENGYPDS